MVIKKVYLINKAMVKALASSYVFFIEFSYFVFLHNIKDKKNTIINTVSSYFMIMWLMEYIKLTEIK